MHVTEQDTGKRWSLQSGVVKCDFVQHVFTPHPVFSKSFKNSPPCFSASVFKSNGYLWFVVHFSALFCPFFSHILRSCFWDHPPSQGLVAFFLQVTVVLVLGEGVVVVVDPLLLKGQSLDLQLCTLGLLHGLQLVRC